MKCSTRNISDETFQKLLEFTITFSLEAYNQSNFEF